MGRVASWTKRRQGLLAGTLPTLGATPRLFGKSRALGRGMLGLVPETGYADLSPITSCGNPSRSYISSHPADTDAPTILCFPNGRESTKSCTICESCRAALAVALFVATVVSGALLDGTAAQTYPRLESLCQSDRERDRTGNPRCGPDRSCIGNCHRWKPLAHCRAGFLLDQFHCSTALAYQRA